MTTTQKNVQVNAKDFGMEATLVGRLTREIRVNNTAVNFTIAMNLAGKDGSKSATTKFVDVTVYDEKFRKIAQGLKKGQVATIKTNFIDSKIETYINKAGEEVTDAKLRIVASDLKAGAKPKIKNA